MLAVGRCEEIVGVERVALAEIRAAAVESVRPGPITTLQLFRRCCALVEELLFSIFNSWTTSTEGVHRHWGFRLALLAAPMRTSSKRTSVKYLNSSVAHEVSAGRGVRMRLPADWAIPTDRNTSRKEMCEKTAAWPRRRPVTVVPIGAAGVERWGWTPALPTEVWMLADLEREVHVNNSQSHRERLIVSWRESGHLGLSTR